MAKRTVAMSIWLSRFGYMGRGLRRAFCVAAPVAAIDGSEDRPGYHG
jgi:hypothetical protein